MALILGERSAAVARELTKRHEEIRRGSLGALAEHYRSAGPPRGEAVIVVGPPEIPAPVTASDLERRLRALLAGHSLRDAVAQLAAETGIARRTLYERALALQQGDPSR
jgi:16S rRNA (cytidine1402-2'-O)-methyltransferase